MINCIIFTIISDSKCIIIVFMLLFKRNVVAEMKYIMFLPIICKIKPIINMKLSLK